MAHQGVTDDRARSVHHVEYARWQHLLSELDERVVASGVNSAGLITTVLPAASAGPSFHTACHSGKFHGVMPKTTPTGSRRT